jgi:hypothetical protein
MSGFFWLFRWFNFKTLDEVLDNAVSNAEDKVINKAICDRGYKGTKETIINAGIKLKRNTQQQINIKREKFK